MFTRDKICICKTLSLHTGSMINPRHVVFSAGLAHLAAKKTGQKEEPLRPPEAQSTHCPVGYGDHKEWLSL